MNRPRQLGLFAMFGLGILAATIGSNLRTPSLQAQTRITLQSLQDQITSLQAQVATLQTQVAAKQDIITAGSGLVKSGNTLSVARPLDADTLGGLPASSFLRVGEPISGDGSGLTNVPASSLTGTISDRRLSTNVALLDANNYFSGNSNVFINKVGIGTTTPAQPLSVNGNIATSGFIFPSVVAPGPANASNAGGLIYNSSISRLQYSDGTVYRTIAIQ